MVGDLIDAQVVLRDVDDMPSWGSGFIPEQPIPRFMFIRDGFDVLDAINVDVLCPHSLQRVNSKDRLWLDNRDGDGSKLTNKILRHIIPDFSGKPPEVSLECLLQTEAHELTAPPLVRLGRLVRVGEGGEILGGGQAEALSQGSASGVAGEALFVVVPARLAEAALESGLELGRLDFLDLPGKRQGWGLTAVTGNWAKG